jgi:hypothetical protein
MANTDNLVELQEVDDFIPVDKFKVIYPHVLIRGISTEEEVIYFHNKFSNPEKSLPLYLQFENSYKCIGNFELTLNNLLIIRCIDNYLLSIVVEEDKEIPINLDEPEQLLKFITLVERG